MLSATPGCNVLRTSLQRQLRAHSVASGAFRPDVTCGDATAGYTTSRAACSHSRNHLLLSQPLHSAHPASCVVALPHAIASTKSGFGLQHQLRLLSRTCAHKHYAVFLLGSRSSSIELEQVACHHSHRRARYSHLRMTMPSSMGVSAMYFSVPSSARSPAPSSTGVVCVWKPAGHHAAFRHSHLGLCRQGHGAEP